MMLNYYPKVGEILLCHFGSAYVRKANGDIDMTGRTSDTRYPPEMVKTRLVVVLNSKFQDGCLVVPLSKSFDQDRLTRKWHVKIAANLIQTTGGFTSIDRYALGEQLQMASKLRLNGLNGGKQFLDRPTVAEIQRAVARTIGAGSLLVSATPTAVPAVVPPSAMAVPAASGQSAANDNVPPAAEVIQE